LTDVNVTSLYEHYATTHAGLAKPAAGRVLKRDILGHIPPSAENILDLGCGQGQLVALCHTAGFSEASGVDISPEQIALGRTAGVSRLECGDALNVLAGSRGMLDAVLATDFIEHLTKDDIVSLFASVHASLRPGGRFIARLPNGASPFHGFYYYGDFTHRSLLNPRSARQLAASAGFADIRFFSCSPVAHGAMSASRAALWRLCEGVLRGISRVETGHNPDVITQNFVFVASRA
jgi:SAM-dependent methyltransferase